MLRKLLHIRYVDFVVFPCHADMLMVIGGVTRHLEEVLRKTYCAAANPKMIVTIGACACGGNIFGQTYVTLGGVDKIGSVYVYTRMSSTPTGDH